jgi:phage terminase large subunit-like protein
MTDTETYYPPYLTLIPGYDPIATKEDCYYDHSVVQPVLDFIENALCFVEGEWSGRLIKLEDWQRAVIANAIGWINPDGTRRYHNVYLTCGRKNGKTMLIAMLMLALSILDPEPGACNYSVAREVQQAAIIFRDMQKMIEANEVLDAETNIYRGYRSIEFANGNIFKALTSEGKSKHGLSIHLLAVDELHCIDDRELLDALTTAQGARKNYMTIYTTTAGIFDPTSLCWETYQLASEIRDGKAIDKSWLPIIFEVPLDAQWDDESLWPLANPNLGVSFPLEFLRQKCHEAKQSVVKQNQFRRLFLNQFTEQSSRWIEMEAWKACNGQPTHEGTLKWYGGLDMSTNTDLSCFTLAAKDPEGVVHVHTFPFLPKDRLTTKEQEDKAPFTTWAKQGYLHTTEGNSIDHAAVRKFINDLHEKYQIVEIAADRWNTAQLITELESDGFTMVAFGQGHKDMDPPSKWLERLILMEQIRHGGHPVLDWAASNVAVEISATEQIKPSKAKSTKRIDPIVSLVMALGRLMEADNTPVVQSIYSTGVYY